MNESIITFATKDGGVVKFSTFQKLRKWLEEERQKWSWLDQDKVFGTQHFSPIKSNIGNLISTCDQVVANPEDQNARQRARQYINELQNLINSGHFALSNTDFGRFVLEFATTDISGAVDMLRASTFSRRHGIPNDAGAIQGVMLWSLYRHGFVKKSFQTSKATISKLILEINEAKKEFEADFEERTLHLDGIISERE